MQRIQKRRAGQRQTQNALIGLLSAVSMTRIGLTQIGRASCRERV